MIKTTYQPEQKWREICLRSGAEQIHPMCRKCFGAAASLALISTGLTLVVNSAGLKKKLTWIRTPTDSYRLSKMGILSYGSPTASCATSSKNMGADGCFLRHQ